MREPRKLKMPEMDTEPQIFFHPHFFTHRPSYKGLQMLSVFNTLVYVKRSICSGRYISLQSQFSTIEHSPIHSNTHVLFHVHSQKFHFTSLVPSSRGVWRIRVGTYLYSFVLHFPELHQLLFAHVTFMFDWFAFMCTRYCFHVSLWVVGIIGGREVFALAKGGHALLISFHVIILLVG